MTEDADLLRKFIDEHSDAAFRELVHRRIGFVYGAAMRQVRGDSHLAQEVAQNVFIDLARKAHVLVGRPNLTGWLYTSTRFAAAKARRTWARRMYYETEAHVMNETLAAKSSGDIDWNELRPVLDATMHELNEMDRDAILLRFFEGRSFAEVGVAIGLAENSARMRVERALEKLRERLARRGITSTAAALGVALAHQPAIAVPAGLAASVAGGALAGAAAAGGGVATALWTLEFMSTTKLILGTIGALVAIGFGGYLGARHQGRVPDSSGTETRITAPAADYTAMREENRQLKEDLVRLKAERSTGAARHAQAATGGGEEDKTLNQLRVLTDLRKRGLAVPDREFVGDAANLTPAFAELFALTSTERDVLQRSVDNARERLAELERENAAVSRTPKGDMMIVVKSFPEAGGIVYDATLKTFADTLGSERYNSFLTLGVEQVEKALRRFGAARRTITVSEVAEARADVRYTLHELISLPKENGLNTSDFKSFEEMAKQVGPIVRLLPADFGRDR